MQIHVFDPKNLSSLGIMKNSSFARYITIVVIVLLAGCSSPAPVETKKSTSYDQLVELFKSWREFQAPVLKEGVPDYTIAAMKEQHAVL